VAAKGYGTREKRFGAQSAVAAWCTVHGPVPRDYSYKLPRKMLLARCARHCRPKLRDGELRVVSAFSLADHKTKSVAGVLRRCTPVKTALLVDFDENRNLMLGARNLEGVKMVEPKRRGPPTIAAPREGFYERGGGQEIVEALAC